LAKTHHEQCQPHHDPEAERRRLFKLQIEERGGESQGWVGGGGMKEKGSFGEKQKEDGKKGNLRSLEINL
jgi:hypothetical protein